MSSYLCDFECFPSAPDSTLLPFSSMMHFDLVIPSALSLFFILSQRTFSSAHRASFGICLVEGLLAVSLFGSCLSELL